MNFTTLIFTATYNEKNNISLLLDKIISLKVQADILIIDDNSPDGTYQIIKNYINKYNFISCIKRNKKKGLDTAHKEAYNYAKKKGYEKFISMDADLSHDPSELKKIDNLLNYFDFVIGSRYINGGKNKMIGLRFFLSVFGNLIIKKVLKIKCSEYTTSYRGYNIKKLKRFNLNLVSSKGYSFFMETIFQINRLGYVIKEIPITFKNRERGKSKIPKIEIFRTIINLIRIKLFK